MTQSKEITKVAPKTYASVAATPRKGKANNRTPADAAISSKKPKLNGTPVKIREAKENPPLAKERPARRRASFSKANHPDGRCCTCSPTAKCMTASCKCKKNNQLCTHCDSDCCHNRKWDYHDTAASKESKPTPSQDAEKSPVPTKAKKPKKKSITKPSPPKAVEEKTDPAKGPPELTQDNPTTAGTAASKPSTQPVSLPSLPGEKTTDVDEAEELIEPPNSVPPLQKSNPFPLFP